MKNTTYHRQGKILPFMLTAGLCAGMAAASGCASAPETGVEVSGEASVNAETKNDVSDKTNTGTNDNIRTAQDGTQAQAQNPSDTSGTGKTTGSGDGTGDERKILSLPRTAARSALLGDGSKPAIGIAWRPDNAEAFYHFWEVTIREAGGIPVNLNEVLSDDVSYDTYGMVSADCVDDTGMLSQQSADLVKEHTYQGSNADEVMKGIDAVFFPGGEDISPSLMAEPDTPKNNGEAFNATRDVSDYLLMDYCIDKDIPVLAVCRGMQMLATVSGGSIIQDIPDYCEEQGIAYNDTHRMLPGTPNRDFTRHDVEITDTESHIYQIVGDTVLENVPSWHHQGVTNLDGTKLKVTGVNVTGDLTMIEAVERTDKTFILGLQFHPEVVCKHILQDQGEDICDYETCLNFIKTLVEYGSAAQESLQPAA